MSAFVIAAPLRAATTSNTPSVCRALPPRSTPTMGPWRKGEKDEAFRQQQEILARRRDKKRNSDYFDDVEKRRENVEEFFDNRTLKVPNGEDPIVAWRKMKENGFVDEDTYTEFDEGGIPIPMASFGIPKYDRGGRFDLRLPHVEVGYTDPDADVMAKAGNALKNMFGFGKKPEQSSDSSDAPRATADSQDTPSEHSSSTEAAAPDTTGTEVDTTTSDAGVTH